MTRHWRARIRMLLGLVAAVVVGWRLDAGGWPWWAWLPAAILTGMTAFMVVMLSWFLYRKLTYERFAAAARRRHRVEG